MLKAIHIYNQHGHKLELPVGFFDKPSEYIITNVSGLGPVKADILTSSFVGMDGGVFQNASVGQRNVVFQVGFNPVFNTNDPYGALRRKLYAFLSPKMNVEMRFIQDGADTVRLFGHVESFEASIFTKEPQVQVSILCPEPNFAALTPVKVTREGGGLMFVDNPGNVDVGFTLTLEEFSSSAANTFILTRTAPIDGRMAFVGAPYTSGPPVVLRVVTNKGRKSAQWTPTATYNPNGPFVGTDVLGYIDGWTDLVPGLNTFRLTFGVAINPYAPVTLSFTPLYSGL